MIDDSDSVSWQMLFDQIDTVWVESIWLLTDRKKMCSGKESDEQTNRHAETKQPVRKHVVCQRHEKREFKQNINMYKSMLFPSSCLIRASDGTILLSVSMSEQWQ